MSITTVFDPPTAADSQSVFNTKAFDTFSKLNAWSGEANALQAAINVLASSAASSQSSAAISESNAAASAAAALSNAAAAAASAGATVWVSGQTYAINDRCFSTVNQRVYIRKTAGAGTTDPSGDATNWKFLAGQRPVYRQATGATASVAVGEWVGLANAAQSTVTLPTVLAVEDEVWISPENGRSDNRIDLNGHTLESSAATFLVIGDPTETVRLIKVGGTVGLRLIY